MKSNHPSDSTEQRLAEIEVLTSLNKQLKLNLISAPVIVNKTKFQLDGYSEKPPVLCEIYSRIGELKIGQKNKIAKDILKMLLIERMMLRQAQHDKMEMPDYNRAIQMLKQSAPGGQHDQEISGLSRTNSKQR
jgi:hypothetical protein